MLESFLVSLVIKILSILLGKAEGEVAKAYQEHEKQKAEGIANAENIKKYDDAKTRADKIRAANDLLNGTRSS